MSILDAIADPDDLKDLSTAELDELAASIRHFLVSNVSKTGGHLGPNLGVVELTIAMHLVFDSPKDPFIFDTGHQSYVHKILTGRKDEFGSLRQRDGLSGYPEPAESEHDWVANSHASTSLSWAEGLARGFALQGVDDRCVVALIGDGALTGGVAWEALNNIAVNDDLPLVVIVNDNGRSYAPTVGGLSRHLTQFRTDPRYEQTLSHIKQSLQTTQLGKQTYDLLHGFKAGVKDILAPQGLFSDLGLKYIGPVDGHDIDALVEALRQAKNFSGPIIVHAVTQKGRGYRAAEEYEVDLFHAIGRIDEDTGKPLDVSTSQTWTQAFSSLMIEVGDQREDVVAVTAAMLDPVGLSRFANAWPDRIFDVGIAEQHALASAAGLAKAGLHPVVCLYSTFLNRAFDQLLLDVAYHESPVTIVLDRAGITGPDGPSHHGVWDVSLATMVPGLVLASPRDEQRLAQALWASLDRPSVSMIRYPKGKLPDPIEAVASHGSVDILAGRDARDVLIIAYGAMCGVAIEAASKLAEQGIEACVIDPVWSLPVSDDLVEVASRFSYVVTLEDNLAAGGVGSLVREKLDTAHHPRVTTLGVPTQFVPHSSRSEIMADLGMDARSIARDISADYARITRESADLDSTTRESF